MGADRPLVGAHDASALKIYRDRYRQGIPSRSVDAEENDARILYRVLFTLGGSALVGQGTELAPGTFYRPNFYKLTMVRLISLILLLAIWWLISQFVEPQILPGPERVLGVIAAQMRSGDLLLSQLGVTLARVLAAFTIAMAAGTAIGLLMGRVKLADRLGDPWLIVLLNLPALVIIVLAFIWGGLTEIAGVLAVAINKLPNTVVTVREGRTRARFGS